jgi:predicted PurR-regulated permease PerM
LAVVASFWRLWGFLLFIGFVVFWFREVALPFVLGLLIAYLLMPSVRRLEPRVGRAGAVIVSYVVLLAALGGFMGVMLPALVDDLSRFRDTAPELMDRLNREWLPRASNWLDESFGKLEGGEAQPAAEPVEPAVYVTPQTDGSYKVALDDLRLEVRETSDGGWLVEPPQGDHGGLGAALKRIVASKSAELTGYLGSAIQSTVSSTFSFVTRFFLTFMIAAFLLVDLERVRSFVRAMVPPSSRADFDLILGSIDRGMSGVIRGQLTICGVNGVLTYIGLLIFGVKYALLLGITAAVFSLIPIFGTIISSIPILVIALVGDPVGFAVGKMVGVLLWIGGIHLLEANFLNPKIIGESAHIHPVVVVFALLAGESVYGLTGALLAVPTASVIQTLFLFTRQQRDARWGTVDGGAPADGDAVD